MFVTDGPLHPDDPLFHGRNGELRNMAKWVFDTGCVGALAGARQTGKTSILFQLHHNLQDRCQVVYIDLQAIYGASVEAFFGYVSSELFDQLSELLPEEHSMELARDSQSFMDLLQNISQQTETIRIVVILDEIGALSLETSIKAAHTIRAIFSIRHVKLEFARYVFILSGSTDMLKLATGKMSPLKNVTESIYLCDLSESETDDLLRMGFREAGLAGADEIRDRIYYWTNGHPYLTELLGQHIVLKFSSGEHLNADDVDSIVDDLLRTEDKNLPHTRRALDKGSPDLWRYVCDIKNGKSIRFSRSNDLVAELELAGLIRESNGYCIIRNRIYETALDYWLDARTSKSKFFFSSAYTRLSRAQWMVVLLIALTLLIDMIMNWIGPPDWLADRGWILWLVLGSAAILFVIVSLSGVGNSASDEQEHEL